MENQQGESSGSHIALDIITSWAKELREEQQRSQAALGFGHESCIIKIGRVRDLTRNVDPVEYDSHHVSIGPYHRIKQPEFLKDDNKLGCLQYVISAARTDVTEEKCLEALAHLEGEARYCYVQSFAMESKEFVRMLLLDACYVLDRFGRRTSGAASAGEQVDTSNTALLPETSCDIVENAKVQRDVFYLAENQIPFFVVQKVYELTTVGTDTSAVDALLGFVQELLQMYSVARPVVAAPSVGNLLHLVHMHLKPTFPCSASSGRTAPAHGCGGRWHSATGYHSSGVKIKSRPIGDNEVKCILDVNLDSSGGTLEVPCLNVNNHTFALLRNLMEMEQRNVGTDSYVTAYCIFMGQLAATASDVEVLSKRSVIVHTLGNNSMVAKYFSELCNGIIFNMDDPKNNYLWGTFLGLEKQFHSLPRRWIAWLQQKYFRNPWLAIGLTAAVIALLCAIVQTVFSVLSYKKGV